jgi:poly(3-hydroxybutyrate) depolymerase
MCAPDVRTCRPRPANYRGSVGFEDATLQSLVGRVGVQDVADVCAFVEAALADVAEYAADRARVLVYGGSHGGFLAAHLLAQHPVRPHVGAHQASPSAHVMWGVQTLFRAAALRNPVIDLGSESTALTLAVLVVCAYWSLTAKVAMGRGQA